MPRIAISVRCALRPAMRMRMVSITTLIKEAYYTMRLLHMTLGGAPCNATMQPSRTHLFWRLPSAGYADYRCLTHTPWWWGLWEHVPV